MKRMLCYGDSNTWGHNPNPEGDHFRYGEEERFTGILQAALTGKVKVVEEGLCGRSLMFDDPVEADRNGKAFFGCAIKSHQPLDLVMIMLGTNDVRHIFTPSVKEIAMGMRNLVQMARDKNLYWVGNIPKVLVVAPPWIRDEIKSSEFYGMYDEESVQKNKKLYEAYCKILEDMEGVYVMDGGKAAEVSLSDCIHLSRQGHRELAEALLTRIKTILEI